MTTNQHNEVTARLLALLVAGGDTRKAKEYLRWAAMPTENTQDEETPATGKKRIASTEDFIARYLTPTEQYDKKEARAFSTKFVRRWEPGLDYAGIATKIQKMQYADFLRTTYWRGIAFSVKRRAKYACEVCGAKEDLAAHHKTYEHHGDEIHHLDDIQCLCRSCHEKVHAKLTDIPMETDW